mgnify:CR=1 FL=1|jgi:hypothetical protein
MKLKIIAILGMAFLISSCVSDDVEQLNINFKLNYDGEPLVFFEDVEYPDGRAFEFTRFSFYVSDLRLSDEGEATQIRDVDYIDLTASHADLASAEQGYDYMLEFEDVSSFDELRMNFGLTDAQNATKPEDYPSSSALSLSGEYWSNWESYVYMKIEGRMDLDNDGVSDGIALHLGSEIARREFSFGNLNSDGEIEIIIDARKIFDNNGVIYDIDAAPRIHSLDQLDKTEILMNNFTSSVEIRN